MLKTCSAIAAAAALTAASVSVPTKADAYPVWVIPAIIAAGVGGVAIGTTAVAASRADSYDAVGNVYVQPRGAANCHIVRERSRSGWRQIEVCD